MTKARKTAYRLCKDIHKDMAWWRTIKVNESGCSLKIKIFSADETGDASPRTVRLSLKGLRSTNDPTFKANKLVDLISKVKCASRADSVAECEDNDSSLQVSLVLFLLFCCFFTLFCFCFWVGFRCCFIIIIYYYYDLLLLVVAVVICDWYDWWCSVFL